MAISTRLKEFLEASKVKYTTAKHPVVYTAQEIAAAQHVPGRQLAKCVLVKTDRGPVLSVLSATCLINLKELKGVIGTTSLTIAKEADIKEVFPDVEVGAMSPFGHLYQVPVVVDKALSESGEIVFNGGTHTETIKMRYEDFASLVKPTTGVFGQPFGGQARAKRKAATRKARTRTAARKTRTRK